MIQLEGWHFALYHIGGELMNNYKDTRLSDTFVNLTDETVHTYEKRTGSIYHFPPQMHELPASPNLSKDQPVIHYILDSKFVQVLTAFGRPLDDIVTVRSEFRGRNQIKITYLAWAKDPEIDVCLYDGAHQANFVHK